jgi:hypothetical protein
MLGTGDRPSGAEVRAMHDDSVLVAVDAALRSPSFCACGTNLTIAVHDGAAWLECPTLAAPTRLPAALASFLRHALHDSRFVTDVPAAEDPAAARVAEPPAAGCSLPAGA